LNQPLETYQDEIYLSGIAGDTPILPASLAALEPLAREKMAPEAFDYICGGAGTEDSVRENAAAFRRWRIVPRMLTNVGAPSYASTVLGASLAAPIMLAPVGVLKRGARGCTVFSEDAKLDFAAVTAEVVDPTGAGDALAAGFLVGGSLEEATRRGLDAAARCIAKVGSLP